MSDTARVITRYGRSCLLERADGSQVEAQFRRRAREAVCGDRVVIDARGDQPVVTAVLPRDNEFARAGRRGEPQVIAANLDRVVVVIAPVPAPTRDLVNRYLVACEAMGVTVALCLNKVDCLDETTRPEFEALAARYRSLGYDFLQTSARSADGLTPLAELVRTGVHILVGQSGVGKSSLVARLLPDRELETRALSRTTGKGRHTTTRITLYPLAGGGAIMDSPGVWEYGIWEMTPEAIAAGFREFAAFAQRCRFSNCTHRTEPGCAVKAAVAEGAIAAERYGSYLRIAG